MCYSPGILISTAMCDETTARHTVSTNEQFVEELMTTYPAANTVPQAILPAAQDGLDYKQAIGTDLESYVRKTVRDELSDAE